jgi:hypothetical protein
VPDTVAGLMVRALAEPESMAYAAIARVTGPGPPSPWVHPIRALANWVGEPPMHVHCETCRLALASEHTGDVYSCNHFVEPRYVRVCMTFVDLPDLPRTSTAYRIRW